MTQVIQLDAILSQAQNEQVEKYSSNTIVEVINEFDYAIDGNEIVSPLTLFYVISPNEIESTSSLEENNKLNFKLFTESLNSTLEFGDLTQLNMGISDVPFPSIESTIVISEPRILSVIGPLSIAPTTSFGVATFIDNIHRLLVFKNDNVSKVGNNDAVVIAGGIRLNPSSTKSEEASSGSAILPEKPVGFLAINIEGVDYKIPYYNS